MPEPAAPAPMPGVLVTGTAVADDVRVVVRCAVDEIGPRTARCVVVAEARLRAVDAVELSLPDDEGAVVEVDGAAAQGPVTLAPGEIALVTLRFERTLAESVRDTDAPWIFTPVRTRHMLLGESTSTRHEGDGAYGEPFVGSRLEVAGTPVLDAEGDVQVDLAAPLSLTLGLAARESSDAIVLHGGPYVGGGIWGPIDDDQSRGALRVGYELGITDWMILGVALETDFDSLAESIVLEIASPELMIILPSLSAGIGVVVRELGPRDADAALRIALGYQIFAAGAYASFDYWPAIGDWTLAAGFRLSL